LDPPPPPDYVIGALEPDDFSSFEVTCTIHGTSSSIPLIIEYRDEDGKIFKETFLVSSGSVGNAPGYSGIQSSSPSRNRPGGMMGFGSGLGRIPILEIAIIVIVVIGALVAWRKGVFEELYSKIKNRDKR